ncbi:MAG: carboxypeptidase regulatory-like domain-containing protein [Parcubacteria group bacterium]
MKKYIVISLISIFGLSAIVPAVSANYGEDNSLLGYVKEYQTLVPLAHAKVKLYKKSGKLKDSDKTNLRGKYHFSDLTEGTYKVKVRVEGYRNPKDIRKDTVSKTIKVDGKDRQNLYLQKM